jgi:hypothetical protein
LKQRRKARDEESPVRAERAGFLFRGERSPSGSEIPRGGIERVMNPLPFSLIRFWGAHPTPEFQYYLPIEEQMLYISE